MQFDGQQITRIWIGSPIDVRQEHNADDILAKTNDSKYWTEEGIIQVDSQRWEAAQKFESDTWSKYWGGAAEDRNHHHKQGFDDYKDISQNLGNVIEIGCGPFTQLQTISQNRIIKSVTLLDPLLDRYKELKACTYKNGKFKTHKATLICKKAEDLDITEKFDTAICINVLEHVQDAKKVLANLYQCLNIGGIVIFGERCYDGLNINAVYDVGHPIKIKMEVFIKWETQFDPLYNIIPKFGDPLHQEHYFIGRKLLN